MFTTFTEDPATGNANGCLAGYPVKHRNFTDTIDVRVEQGAEEGHPLIYLRATERSRDEMEVNVGGRCTTVAQGELV